MAVQTITYTNKVDLNTTSVADINKVKASDLNEIKSVVNNNASILLTTSQNKFMSGLVKSSDMTSTTIGGTSGKMAIISFNDYFTNTPDVVVSVWNNNPGSYGAVTCAVGSISAGSCKLYMLANVSANDIGLTWIARGN